MREILFRGKRTYNGEWIEGHLIWCEDGRARIIPSHTDIFCYEMDESIIQTVAHRVIPETVGQYTGLTDKNGAKIFEGDIISFECSGCALITWDDDDARFVILYDENDKTDFSAFGGEDVEIIGNIHDDHELLDGAGNG